MSAAGPAAAGPTSAPSPLPLPGSRSRPQARRKPNDDAPYVGGGLTVGGKRHASDKVDGEPRVKRKRVVDAANSAMTGGPSSSVAGRKADRTGAEDDTAKISLEFAKLPTATLYRYLSQFNLVPMVRPSPLTADDPPPPSSLELGLLSRAPSPPPPPTPANRPRRDPKEQTRRRSLRLAEDDVMSRTPILADVQELHAVLAEIVEKHFRDEHAVKEVDTLSSFMCCVKAKGGGY